MLVLLPGLDGTEVLFEPLLKELELQAQTVRYPQVEAAGYADLLPGVLDALPKDERFVLLGWSFSGPLALLAAARRPTGLAGVILCASFVRKPVRFVPRWARYLVRPGLCARFGRLSRLKALTGGYSTPALDDLLARAHQRVPATVIAARVRATLSVNVESELRACPVPVLYLGGTRDFVVPRNNALSISKLRPNVQTVFISGPHLALATNPVAAAAVVTRFCQRSLAQ